MLKWSKIAGFLYWDIINVNELMLINTWNVKLNIFYNFRNYFVHSDFSFCFSHHSIRCTSSNISAIRIILIIIEEELYLFDENDNLS